MRTSQIPLITHVFGKRASNRFLFMGSFLKSDSSRTESIFFVVFLFFTRQVVFTEENMLLFA